MLSGQVPFPRTSLSAFAEPPAQLATLVPEVSPALAALVHSMLSPKADGRPSMAEVVSGLLPPVPVESTGRMDRVPPPPRSIWPRVIGTLVGLGFVLGGGALLFHQLRPQPVDPASFEAKDLQLDVSGPRARALGVLYLGLKAPEPALRAQAAEALGQSQDTAQWTSIASLLKDSELSVQAAAAEALGQLGAPDSQSTLLPLLEPSVPIGVRIAAAGTLARLGEARGQDALRQLLNSTDEATKIRAALLLLDTGDLQVKPVLWAALRRPGLPEERTMSLLSRLAGVGDSQAQQQLAARMAGEGFGLKRISAAGNLARTGDERARAVLKQAAQTSGPQQPLASLMLATVGDSSGFTRFVRAAVDPSQPLEARQLAMEGVAACGRRQGAIDLVKVLDESTAPASLRQAAAGAIVRIAGGDPEQIAKQSMNWANVALGHENWQVRESATQVLAELDGEQAVGLLAKALEDSQKAVRKSAATALGGKRVRTALAALRKALTDADPEVRQAGMMAASRVFESMGRGSVQDQELMAGLRRLTEIGSPEDQVIAAGTLLRMGDSSQLQRLRDGLQAPDALLRQLVVETVPSGNSLIAEALADAALPVRFAAAKRLVPQRSPELVKVLQEAMQQGGAVGIQAYTALKKMGERVSPPAGFGELLSQGDALISLAMMDVVADLPIAEAMPLLDKARFDSSPQVRRRVAEVAVAFYQAAPSEALQTLIYKLLHDPDVSVRARVSRLVQQLTRAGAFPDLGAAPEDLAVVDAGSDAGTDAGAGLRGYFKVQGEDKVHFQLDNGSQHTLTPEGLLVPVTPGHHIFRFQGGVVEADASDGETTAVTIPLSYSVQVLAEAADATTHREFVRAQKLLDRVRQLAASSRVPRTALAELSFQQARLFDLSNRPLDAMLEYERLLKVSEPVRRPEQTAATMEAVGRLRGKLGRLEIFQEVEGRCEHTVQWVRPGETMLDQGQNQGPLVGARVGMPVGTGQRSLRIREGQRVEIGSCKSSVP